MAKPIVTLEDPGQLTLQWDTPLDSGGLPVTGYTIQSRRLFENGSWSLSEVVYDGRASIVHTALITNLLADTEYALSVTALNYRSLCLPNEYVTPGDELLVKTQDDSVPSRPMKVGAVDITGGSISLIWDPPVSIGRDVLLWYLVNGSFAGHQPQPMGSVNATTTTSITFNGLIASTTYNFVVAAQNSVGIGSSSSLLSVTTSIPTPPSQPKNFHQIPFPSGGRIGLMWEVPDDAGGSQLQRYFLFRNGSLVDVIEALTNSTVFYDMDNILANQVYNYTVLASNAVATGNLAASLIVSSGMASVPTAPTAFILQIGGGSFGIECTPSPDSGGIPIRYCQATVFRELAVVGFYEAPDSRLVISGLFAQTAYWVAVQTVNDMGSSIASNLNVTTNTATLPDKMSTPRLMEVTGGRMRLQVEPPSDFGGSVIVTYIFYVNDEQSDALWQSTGVYDLVGFSAITSYDISVLAVNEIGEGARSDAVSIVTSPISLPSAISGVTLVSKTQEMIQVAWNSPSDTGGDALNLKYDAQIYSNAIDGSTVVDVISPLVLPNLNPAILYTIQVRAKNSFGLGEWSPGLAITTDPVAPGIISFVQNETTISEASGAANLSVIRTEGGFIRAACSFHTVNGTALSGIDYVKSVGTLEFQPGVTSRVLAIPVINNMVADDPDKYFFVVIEVYDAASGVIGVFATIQVTIADDGDAGVLVFGEDSYSVLESATNLIVTVVRTLAFSGAASVAIDALDFPGEAVQNVDYTLNTSVIQLADYQTEASIFITIKNDATYQIRKTFGLQLRVLSGRPSIGTPMPVIVEILDDGDISAPGVPTAVTTKPVSGGVVNITWLSPVNQGAENVAALAFTIWLVDPQRNVSREMTSWVENIIVANLLAWAAYEISIAARNSLFLGEFSAPVTFRMGQPTPPSSPLNAQVLGRTGGSAGLSWTSPLDLGGATFGSYRVTVNASDSGDNVGVFTAGDAFALVYGLLPLMSYTVVIQAINSESLVGDGSTPLVLTTLAASVPGKPAGLVLTKATGGALYVSMAPSLDDGGTPILTFFLYMTSTQFPSVFNEVYRGPNSTFVASRLPYSTSYKLQYKVSNAVGTSDLSDTLVATTTFLTQPDEPQLLEVVSQTGGAVTISWTPPTDFGGNVIINYDVSYFLGFEAKAQYQQRVVDLSPNATSVTAKVGGLFANSTYGFFVTGVNEISACVDPSVPFGSTIVYATTAAVSVPDTPQNLAIVRITAGTQTVQWSVSDDTGGDLTLNYVLYSDTNAILYNGTKAAFTRGLLTRNTLYGYTVTAWNSAGTSVRSGLVSARTNPVLTVPNPPVELTQSSATGGSLSLTWQSPIDTGGEALSGYKIYRNGIWRADVAITGDLMSYLDDEGLVAQQDYVYVILAANSIGLSTASDSLIAQTTQPSTPNPIKGIIATANGGKVSATWTPADNTGGIPLTFFRVQLLLAMEMIASAEMTTLFYDYYGVRANSTYTLSVIAVNTVGESLSAVQIVTNGAAIQPAAPPVPTMVSFVARKVVLALLLPIDDGGAPISKLNVYQNGTNVLSISSNRSIQVEVGPLRASSVYAFTVGAVSIEELGESNRSEAVLVTTETASIPSAPYNVVVAQRTAYSLRVTWDGPDDTGGDDIIYEVSYQDSSSSRSNMTGLNVQELEVDYLTPSTSYLIQVRAKNSAGSSGWTDGLSVETDVALRGIVIFQVLHPLVFENETSVAIQLVRVNGSSHTITCNYALNSTGTAISGKDFVLPPEAERTITFLEGETLHEFVIQIVNNTVYDPVPRTIKLILTDTTVRADVVLPSSATITIVDDGDAGHIGFVNATVNVSESARSLTLPLQRLGGSSSATSVRIMIFTGLPSTTQAEIGFRLPSTEIGFADGQITGNASVVIKDNDAYDFPYLYFYLTLEIVSGGGQIGTNSVVRVTVLDDGDRSVPGLMTTPIMTSTTGGMLVFKWDPPVNVGAQSLWITGYNASLRSANSIKTVVTSTNATTLAFGNLRVLTSYNFTIAAINTIGRGAFSPNFTFATSNYTTPGPTAQIDLFNHTGGQITVNVTTPLDTGGAPVKGYLLYSVEDNGDYKVRITSAKDGKNVWLLTNLSTLFELCDLQMVYNGSTLPSSVISVSVDKPETMYWIRAQVPIGLALGEPLDAGGHEDISYMFYYREQGLDKRFRMAYYDIQGLEAFLFRLAAETTYEVVGVSCLPADLTEMAWGTFQPANMSITLSESVVGTINEMSFFDFGGYLFEVDSSQSVTVDAVVYSASLSTDEGVIASTDLTAGDEYPIYMRGEFSEIETFTTALPTRPGLPPEPTLSYSTGGALHIRLSSPNDTGTFYEYSSQGAFDLQVTVEIGGLSPETEYYFYFIPTNDVSACPGVNEHVLSPVKLQTDVPSAPTPIQVIRQSGATGGGIHVEWDVPTDVGSDGVLFYQVYMSPSRFSTPVWTLMYNGTGTTYWQTKLTKVTEYLFKASCRNEIGYAANSSVSPLSTSYVSAPGPPGNLQYQNATGGMIQFSWDSPEDDGGSSITYYVVYGRDSSSEVASSVEVETAEVFFGGLVANSEYEFKVYAGNILGLGTDPGVAVFSTTKITAPSPPGEPQVLSSSGGSVTLAIPAPEDTGGMDIEDFACEVFANGVAIPLESVQRLQNAPETAATSSDSRRLSTIPARRKLVTADAQFLYIKAGGLVPSVTYTFAIQVSNDVGQSDITGGAEGVTSMASVPAIPDPPKAAGITGGALKLSWSDPVDTGGVPLTSYLLTLVGLDEEVGRCEGLIHSCTIGNLLSLTEYIVTLLASNAIGSSPPSEPVIYTTTVASLPQAPQNPQIASTSNTFVTVEWEPCIDFGGAYVESYLMEVTQILNSSVTYQETISVNQLNATISGLTPKMDYVVTVVRKAL
ncbi:hypothetical protein BBJ28_00002550 [Nothophytophthora sp. Chile5]|nr:hypothetical protein BBJ28_00002550 [Nothophytophthora sp. Chile5]